MHETYSWYCMRVLLQSPYICQLYDCMHMHCTSAVAATAARPPPPPPLVPIYTVSKKT
jgi:hypothetical protein